MRKAIAAFFAVGLLALAAAWQAYGEERALAGAPTASVKVVELQRVGKNRVDLVVDLTLPSGQVARTTVERYREQPMRGDSLLVQYTFDEGAVVAREAGMSAERDQWLYLGGGVASLLVGVGLLIWSRRNQQVDPVQDAL